MRNEEKATNNLEILSPYGTQGWASWFTYDLSSVEEKEALCIFNSDAFTNKSIMTR